MYTRSQDDNLKREKYMYCAKCSYSVSRFVDEEKDLSQIDSPVQLSI